MVRITAIAPNEAIQMSACNMPWTRRERRTWKSSCINEPHKRDTVWKREAPQELLLKSLWLHLAQFKRKLEEQLLVVVGPAWEGYLWEASADMLSPHLVVVTWVFSLKISSQAPVAHGCNPSYSGGSDLEGLGSKPAQANSSWDPILKKTHHKKQGWWSDSRCRSWVQTLVPQKKIQKI
jgi:hypothetical protein